jgi:epoxyqueuosine reductase
MIPAEERAPGADYGGLAEAIKSWGRGLGFQQVGITGTVLDDDEAHLLEWLARGYHGEMAYMARHGTRRSRPADLVAGTLRIISVRMDYFPAGAADAGGVLRDPLKGYVSRYAVGRDYHRLLRRRLRRLARRVAEQIGPYGYRVYADSAPVLEKALARDAGLGWIGKHTNLIHSRAGSWFFLGEIYTDLPLPADPPQSRGHCGRCSACIEVCPTRAIVAPYRLDARRCISYLTIEHRGPIPEPLRPLIGNRIYGCDDCQLVCPWNRFAKLSCERDFAPRHGLDAPELTTLFAWSEAEFLSRTEGSAIRRIGYTAWLRNLAVALGNAPGTPAVISALRARSAHPSALVREHVSWALRQHQAGYTDRPLRSGDRNPAIT